jgi:hypothetical protein
VPDAAIDVFIIDRRGLLFVETAANAPGLKRIVEK